MRCFELLTLDPVPTIEDYDIMLKLLAKEKARVYLYKGSYNKKVIELIGLSMDRVEFKSKGSVWGNLPRSPLGDSSLKDRLETL